MTVLLIVCQIFMENYLDKMKMIIYLLKWNWKWRWFSFEHWVWSSYLFWAVIHMLLVSAYNITSSLFIHEPNLNLFCSVCYCQEPPWGCSYKLMDNLQLISFLKFKFQWQKKLKELAVVHNYKVCVTTFSELKWSFKIIAAGYGVCCL